MSTSEERIEWAKTEHVEADGSFWTWLPQVGGYCSPCRVRLLGNGDGPDFLGCFDVDVFHDGEFPTNDEAEPTIVLHFCDVAQLEEFAAVVRRRMGGG